MKPGLVAFGVALALCSGCSLFNGSGGGGGGGGTYGYGSPTLQVTIGGATYGPSVLDGVSRVSIVDQGTSGALSQSSIDLVLSSSVTGASCILHAERYGTDVQPIVANTYALISPTGAQTEDGSVAPGAGEQMTVPDGSFSCSGTDCDGGSIVFTTMQADHVEGYLSADVNDSAGRGTTSGTCSFWAPVTTYQR